MAVEMVRFYQRGHYIGNTHHYAASIRDIYQLRTSAEHRFWFTSIVVTAIRHEMTSLLSLRRYIVYYDGVVHYL